MANPRRGASLSAPKTWPEFLDSVVIKFPFPIELRARVSDEQDAVELRVAMTVPDVNGGAEIRVYSVDYAPPFKDVKYPADYLRAQILKALAHEVDESIFIGGEKARDPHALADEHGVFHPRFL